MGFITFSFPFQKLPVATDAAWREQQVATGPREAPNTPSEVASPVDHSGIISVRVQISITPPETEGSGIRGQSKGGNLKFCSLIS